MESALGGQKLLLDGIQQKFETIWANLAVAGAEPTKINLELQSNAQKRGMPAVSSSAEVRGSHTKPWAYDGRCSSTGPTTRTATGWGSS